MGELGHFISWAGSASGTIDTFSLFYSVTITDMNPVVGLCFFRSQLAP